MIEEASFEEDMRSVAWAKETPNPMGTIKSIGYFEGHDYVNGYGYAKGDELIKLKVEIFEDTVNFLYPPPETTDDFSQIERIVEYCGASLYSIKAIEGNQIPMCYTPDGWKTNFEWGPERVILSEMSDLQKELYYDNQNPDMAEMGESLGEMSKKNIILGFIVMVLVFSVPIGLWYLILTGFFF